MPVEIGANTAFVEAEFGGPITTQVQTIAVTPSVVRVLDSNPEALSADLINLGGNSLFIAPDDGVSATHGILLAANGGFLSLNVRSDQLLPALPWYATSPDGDTSLYVIRLYRYSLAPQRTG